MCFKMKVWGEATGSECETGANSITAREASRRIVDDILMDAGADMESSEYSPTMVKMNEDILNDSF